MRLGIKNDSAPKHQGGSTVPPSLCAGMKNSSAPMVDACRWCFDQGVLVRVTGDIVALSPPLIIENHHVDRLFGTLSDAIRAVPA
jgi:adenosylmethionine-8-amino-7-oxononanoate aminotransferase